MYISTEQMQDQISFASYFEGRLTRYPRLPITYTLLDILEFEAFPAGAELHIILQTSDYPHSYTDGFIEC